MRHVLALSLAATFTLVTGSRAISNSLRPSIDDTLVTGSCSSPAFGSPRYFAATGSYTDAFDAADVNGDAHVDFVAIDGVPKVGGWTQALNVFLGDGGGGFTLTASDLPGDVEFYFVRAVDVTGDGRRDLVLAGWAPVLVVPWIVVLRGDGTGAFAPLSSVSFGNAMAPAGFAMGDLDEDGDLDVVFSTVKDDATSAGTVHVLKGDGAGNFAAPTDVAVGTNPSGLTLGDFNEDGHLDLAISLYGVDYASGVVEIRLGDPVGGFGPVMSSQPVPAPYALATGDFNEDTHLDLAVATSPYNQPGTATLLAGEGSGQIAAPVSFPLAGHAFGVVSADLTGDGHLDLLFSGASYMAQTRASFFEVVVGGGDGNFAGPTVLPISGDGGAFLPAVGDFDSDGRPDVAGAGAGPRGGARIAMLLSMCGNEADLAVSLTSTPDPVLFGQTAEHTIEVVNNGPDPAGVTMSLAIPAGLSFVSASATVGACVPSTNAAVPSPWDRTVRCTAGDLAGSTPGNSSTITVVSTGVTAGIWTTVATVATTVLDAVPGNDTATASTLVTVLGGSNLTIAAAPAGGTSLTWTAGNAQAGYIVWRSAGAVTTRFPASGLLPADISAFTDESAIEGQRNCYRLVAAASDETPIAASSVLCLFPNSASPAGALGDFRLRLVSTDAVRMDWSPFVGRTGYVMRRYTAGGQNEFSLASIDTSIFLTMVESTCFVLIPVNGSTPLGNSTVLCAQPGTTP